MTDKDKMEIGGKQFISADAVKARFDISEMTLQAWKGKGMPAPLKIARRRFYDSEDLESWLLTLR